MSLLIYLTNITAYQKFGTTSWTRKFTNGIQTRRSSGRSEVSRTLAHPRAVAVNTNCL
ncbi:TPA: hypothetical protein U5H14_001099 [Listeria monocytogenes]|nr:hypothetical protein [Listeria monocytogenes]HEN3934755.1 hypothetical protein [Listeria monocytogenes]